MIVSFSVDTRNSNLQKMKTESFDLAIVGGGITGAGVARDAASRGMKVALVESDDFAFGTSSRSSKLIHGGIRYLENLEFGLVFEALSERSHLFNIAPHLVHPLRFVLPVYQGARVGMLKMGLGMWLYDLLATFQAPRMHERLSAEETMKRVSMLNPKKLAGAYVYSDAYMDDDRLVIETLRSAHNSGAVSANFVRATGVEIKSGKVSQLKVKDLVSNTEFGIHAKHFVSTVGPWTDDLGAKFFKDWKPILRTTKGVHLTIPRGRLALDDAVVMISDDQKRIVFAIPRHEMTIVGTTDTSFSGDPADVATTREDVDYLLSVVDNYFPGADLVESDILASYSGVRPLVEDGADTEGKTSREHLIVGNHRNVTFVTGGKYTTYRKMAEDTVNATLEAFSFDDRVKFGQSNTLVPLNPRATTEKLFRSQQMVARWSREFDLNVGVVNFLVERHGEEAHEILSKHGEMAKSSQLPPIWFLEAHHALESTMCLNLLDFYLRRSPLFLAGEQHGYLWSEHLAKIFQNRVGWDSKERITQINALQDHQNREMSWQHLARS